MDQNVTLTREQILSLVRAKTAELNVYREALGLPITYIHEHAGRRRRPRPETARDQDAPTAGDLASACCG